MNKRLLCLHHTKYTMGNPLKNLTLDEVNEYFEMWLQTYKVYLEQLYRIVFLYSNKHITRDSFNKIVFFHSSRYISKWA